MTPEERNLVIELFDRLATLEDAQRDLEAERLIKQGGVEIGEQRVDNFRKDIDLSRPSEFLLRAGKKKFLRILVE